MCHCGRCIALAALWYSLWVCIVLFVFHTPTHHSSHHTHTHTPVNTRKRANKGHKEISTVSSETWMDREFLLRGDCNEKMLLHGTQSHFAEVCCVVACIVLRSINITHTHHQSIIITHNTVDLETRI